MKRRLLALPMALVGVAAADVLRWEDLTESDWLYAVATRYALVDGHRVHYPTPTAELAAALEARAETAALRHLADARRAMGDAAGAVAALERWAEAEGPPGWAEAARWGAAHADWPLAFRAAAKALSGLGGDDRRALADEQVAWADAHPEHLDPLVARKTRADLFPADARALEEWIRGLDRADRIDEALAALAATQALAPERRVLLRSDLLADRGDATRAFEVLDEALLQGPPWSPSAKQAYAARADRAANAAPASWRAALEKAFDAHALLRLATYFQGQSRGDAAADLLRQVERRYEGGLDRSGWLLLARLHGEIDAVPEAFRASLAAAQTAGSDARTGDLAPLARLALRAGARPLAWGTYNDAPYRWVARIDRTPGFWTGGVSFLLTGEDWNEALAHLESESLPERTFAAARALVSELAARAAAHPELPALRVAIMERHVERGEGEEALALLPGLESGPPEVAREAQRVALLAARLVSLPLDEEVRLLRARLRSLAPDGSKPSLVARPAYGDWDGSRADEPWRRPPPPEEDPYRVALEQAIARLDERDRSHGASVDLILGEMDRMPDAEELWSELASKLEGWNLDDELAPRYERALERFRGPGPWARAARWYARRARHRDLERLAAELSARFRGAAVFAPLDEEAGLTLEIPEQPRAGARVRLVTWADWVRLKALERFPQSPTVFKQALGRLVTRSAWERDRATLDQASPQRVVVEDDLVETRRWALLFADPERREEYLAAAARAGSLERSLVEIEGRAERTPVEERLLFDGWSRLSGFERAAAPASRLASAYPGDADLALQVVTLHRSLAALEPDRAAAARAAVARTAPALVDPAPLWTALGELEEDAGRPEEAQRTWRQILDRDPRSAERVSELATLLWDYGHMPEALAVVEEARTRLGRPRLLAFEAGVLREERGDVQGAVREYLEALLPEDDQCFCSTFERDQRSLRRLAQLLARSRVLEAALRRVLDLKPGVRADEQTLASLFPLATIELPTPGDVGTVDDWIDAADLPSDPVGRADREAARRTWRVRAREAIDRVGDGLVQKALAMVPRATAVEFLDAAEGWVGRLPAARLPKERDLTFRGAAMARRAELAPSEEERVAREVERARWLLENGRRDEADEAWSSLAARIGALPEGASRMRAEADRARYLERARGVEAAADAWRELMSRYPWSLGLLEDRLAFLFRTGRGDEGRRALLAVSARAASGHRENLLERLTREALQAQDLDQARRAVSQLVREPGLEDGQRLGALHLLARLELREDAGFDAVALGRAEAARLKPESHAELYAQLARAADLEGAGPAALALWIEALNRRLDRGFIGEAFRAAARAGRERALVEFFEEQQARSPRDVRWAVAVRELRLHAHDLEGAIAMSKAAVAVRPDRESLWRETADLLVRAGRVREAADFLEGWSVPRPADEDAARRRSRLYAWAGDAAKAGAVEQAALDAYTRRAPLDEERERELGARRARAARRLLEYGHADLAWRLAGGEDGKSVVLESALGAWEQAELALAGGHFVRLLRDRAGDADFLGSAAQLLSQRGRSDHKDDVQAFLVAQLLPRPGAAAPGDDAALRRLWPLVRDAGLEAPVRAALARRLLARSPGPWQAEPGASFVESVGATLVAERPPGRGGSGPGFRVPDLEALWVRELVRLDRAEALWTFLLPRWNDLLARVRLDVPLGKNVARLGWTAWLDDAAAMETWARGAAERPERVADIAAVMAERRRWDRLWALGARGWPVATLVAALPEEARVAWFRHWRTPSPLDPDPVLRARGTTLEHASVALGRLLAGDAAAAADPIVRKLRGPRTVGDVLGNDGAWTWPEFAPRRGASAEPLEAAGERAYGRGADAGRLPGALWGDRPGTAWYALETLARFREGDATAALLPLESPQRGAEAERASLATELAAAMGDTALALELARAGETTSRTAARVRLLVGAGRREDAAAALGEHVRRRQPTMTEAELRALQRLAQDLELPAPIDLLDAAAPLPPPLLAYLYDHAGPASASRFHPRDVVDFRAALAGRWQQQEGSLGAEEVRFLLAELWTSGASALPRRDLRRLGGLWPQAADWLAERPVAERSDALAAVAELPDSTRLDGLLAGAGEPPTEAARLLKLRARLARGEETRALDLVDEMLRELESGTGLALVAADSTAGEDLEGGENETEEQETPATESDPLVTRLRSWLRPFREAGRLAAVEPRISELLRSRRARGPVSPSAWRLALELAPDRPALLNELEHAWIRGDFAGIAVLEIAEALAPLAPVESRRWLERTAPDLSYGAVERRALVLARLEDAAAAAAVLVDGRTSGLWSEEDDVRAFDRWRAVAAPAGATAPPGAGPGATAAWTAARVFWTRPPGEIGADLARHLRDHPYDRLSARAALRTAAPGHEDAMHQAAAVLLLPGADSTGRSYSDAGFLRLRAARGLVHASWRAARHALDDTDTAALARDLAARRIPRNEIAAAVADIGKIAAASGEAPLAESALATLEDRDPVEARRLRAAYETLRPHSPPRPYRIDAGRPVPYRPRDLDWRVVSASVAEDKP